MTAGPDIFLSSPLLNFAEVREKIRAIDPQRIHDPVDTREAADNSGAILSAFEIVDECITQIQRSSLFICVLRDRYGTSLFARPNESEETESVSYLETEIFEAAFSHSNVHFFLMEPFDPSPKLRGLLDLIELVRPGIIPDRAVPESVLLGQIERLIRRTPRRKPFWTSLTRRDLVGGLEMSRGHSDLEFLGKTFRPVSKRPDLDHIRFLLNSLEGEPGIEKQLARTWIAIRELSAAPYDRPEFGEYLPYWDQALGLWSSAAAWYGLHGHLYAGRLAAINSLLAIRERLPNLALGSRDERNFHGTKGSRASEYYSIAKLMRGRKKRTEYFRLAELDIEEAMRSGTEATAGYLTIRGHIRLRQGNPELALADLKEAMRLNEKRGDAAIAESLADLGYAQMELGNVTAAVRLLEESVQRLTSAGDVTFTIRAKKRLALAQLRAFRPNRAAHELNEAYDLAEAHKVRDQIAPVMELIHRISVVTGLWKRRS